MKPESIVIHHAKRWWKNKRPIAFTEKEHHANPTINTLNGIEHCLAKAVSKLIQDQQEKANTTPKRTKRKGGGQ